MEREGGFGVERNIHLTDCFVAVESAVDAGQDHGDLRVVELEPKQRQSGLQLIGRHALRRRGRLRVL